jgi:uncharacterized repeat protein (TIGR04076 family)
MDSEQKEKVQRRWQKIQEILVYTDEDLAIHRSNPKHVRLVESAPAFSKYNMIIEVIEANNCAAGHKVGDKFVVDGEGCLVVDECPSRLCVAAIFAIKPLVDRMWQAFYDNTTDVLHDTVHCTDVGVHRGGWGEITMRIHAVPKYTAKR